MAKFRVYEVAKKFGKDNKEILDILKAKKFDVKNHMSTIGDEQISVIEKVLAPKKNANKNKQNNQQNGQKKRQS